MDNEPIYEFHHLGIPTAEARPGERFSSRFGVYTSDAPSEFLRVQYHRYTPDSPFPALVQTLPHAAFKVNNLEQAIAGRVVIVAPFEPIENFRVAFIDDHGFPVEFIETTLSDQEIWNRATTRKNAPLYSKDGMEVAHS